MTSASDSAGSRPGRVVAGDGDEGDHLNKTKNTAATATVRRMRDTGKWRFKGADAEELAAELASLIGARHRRASNDAEQWVVDPRTVLAEVER